MLPSISPSTASEESSSQVVETYMNMTSSERLNQTAVLSVEDSVSFDDFAPTLAQCFFIVLTSYFIGKIKLLSASDVRGVSVFAAYFAMPGIICVKLADADIENLEWQLLIGTILGKAIIFALVTGCTMLVTQPIDVSTAAMLAMFCVQCNDLPVGNPLMSSLYGVRRPHMLKYLFLIPALTILIFGPLTHIMMASAKDGRKPLEDVILRSNSDTTIFSKVWRKMRHIIFHRITGEIILSLMKNPVIIATFFGIILNVSFKAHVPSVLHQPINVVATMIPGLALSVLGFSMLGKEKHILSSGIILASVLIAVKMVMTPLVLFSSVKLFAQDQHQEMLDFSLLYGIISPAAIVFQYGERYRFPIAGMSAALIMSSFTCFPLSYIIAKLSLERNHGLDYYIPNLRSILLFVAIMTLLCCILVWISFIWKKEWKKVPCWYIFYLAFTQILMSVGVILWQVGDVNYPWILEGQIVLSCGGEIMISLCTTILFLLLVIQQHNQSTLGKYSVAVLISTLGLSVIGIILFCGNLFRYNLRRALLYGQPKYDHEHFQLQIVTAVLAVLLIIGAISYILYRKGWGLMKDFKDPMVIPLETQADRKKSSAYAINAKIAESEDAEKRASTISTVSTAISLNDDVEKTLYYDEIIKTSQSEKVLVFGAEWTPRIINLLIILWITIAIKFLANMMKVAECKVSAIVVPLEYLQAITFTGQGLWTFLICGVDIRTAFISLKKRWRQMRHGKEKFQKDFAPTDNEEIQKLCQQFQMFFYDQSFNELAKERMWKKNHYQNSFWGHQMVNWFIKAGVAKDELEAEEYGQKLLLGGLISHVRNAHQFLDAPYLYYFVKN